MVVEVTEPPVLEVLELAFIRPEPALLRCDMAGGVNLSIQATISTAEGFQETASSMGDLMAMLGPRCMLIRAHQRLRAKEAKEEAKRLLPDCKSRPKAPGRF